MKTLKIIGSGIKGAMHLTLESLHALEESNKILWLGNIDGLSELISKNNWIAEDITSYYENGALDSDNYYNIKNKILREIDKIESISFIVHGHPRLGVTIVQELQQDADVHKIKLEVLPGISSFDTMFNDLAIDPIEEGTCILDANRLILYDYQMESCLNYFIYHVCSIGNSNTDYKFPSANNKVSFLKKKLLKHYSASHEVVLLTSSMSDSYSATNIKSSVDSLDVLLDNVTFKSSLYIPSILPTQSKINKEFYDFIMSRLPKKQFLNISENKM